MRSTRTDQECADILYDVLRRGQALTRKRLVEDGVMTGHDFCRGRKILARAGVLDMISGQGYLLRIHLLGGPPEPAAPARPLQPQVCERFGGLLSAWQIRLPAEPVGTSRCVNRRFARDDGDSAVDRDPDGPLGAIRRLCPAEP